MSPPPKLTVSEWADRYRQLSPEASAEPGQWVTNRAPFQQGIMDTVTDTMVEDVIVISSSQVGKTEIILNIIGYYIDYDPSPILVVNPTNKMAEAFSKDRLTTMIRDTPVLKNKVKDSKSRDSENTIQHKKFPGGHITLIGANAPSDLASRPIRIVLCDEIDRYPSNAGKEGDPVKLAEKRTNNFWNRKKIKFSTPTIKGVSSIEKEYNDSSKGEWCVPCPCCGKLQPYSWGRIRFEDATMECEYCQERFNKTEWGEGKGQWIEGKENSKKKGFHLNELASPWRSWEEIIKSFKDANKTFKESGSTNELQVFINTSLGETWELKGESANEDSLLSRRERYRADLPDGVLLLTAGVDVQDNRFEIEIVGWAKGYESWGIQYKQIFCDPAKEESWNELENFLDEELYFENGTELQIAATFVDTGGHFTTESYKWLKKTEKKHKHIYGIKGMGGIGLNLIHKESRNNKENIRIFILGVDSGKEVILSRLKTVDEGPNYCHFPINIERGYDEMFMKGINSEQRVIRTVNNRPKIEWVKKSGTRNEPLDLRNYATAAVELLSPNWDSLKAKINAGINYTKKSNTAIKRNRGVVNKGIQI